MTNRTYKPCIICMTISGLWILLSLGVVTGYLGGSEWLVPVAILMGASVAGIADKWGDKTKKIITLAIGLPAVYFFVTNLSLTVVAVELIIMIVLAAILFRAPNSEKANENNNEIEKLKDKLNNCC